MGVMGALREAILNKYGAKDATEPETHQLLFNGYDAIQRGLDMVWPSRDTILPQHYAFHSLQRL
jgi:hypothetical protein